MAGFGWYYPPGAANDPYAPYNAVECPDCEEEFSPLDIKSHMEEVHGWEEEPPDDDDYPDDDPAWDYIN